MLWRAVRFCFLGLAGVACANAPNHPPSVVIPRPEVAKARGPESEMVRLEGGTYKMLDIAYPFSPGPTVTIAPFEIGRTEVTTAAYRECVRAGACSVPVGVQEPDPRKRWPPKCMEQLATQCNFARNDRDNHPVNCLTFTQAEQYCLFREMRMPTEAEWEFAAFGVQHRTYPGIARARTCVKKRASR